MVSHEFKRLQKTGYRQLEPDNKMQLPTGDWAGRTFVEHA